MNLFYRTLVRLRGNDNYENPLLLCNDPDNYFLLW
jgi:hypothetical protein